MSLSIYLFSFVVFILFVIYLWQRRKYYVLSWKLESLLGLPFFGIALNVRSPERLISYIGEVRKNFKSKNALIWFGPQPIFYVSEPQLMKKIFTSPNFVNKMYLYANFSKHFGNGIISSNSPIWNHHRKILDPFFTNKNVKLFLTLFNEEADNLMRNFEKQRQSGRPFDIIPFMHLCTLDLWARTTLGQKMNFQQNLNSEIIDNVLCLLNLTIVKCANPFYANEFIYDRTKYGKLCAEKKAGLRKYVLEVFTQSQKETSAEHTQCDEKEEQPNIFMNQALQIMENKEFTINDVLDEILALLSGSDTASNTVSYVLICMAMFPEYQEKLFEEVLALFPDKNDVVMTAEKSKELIYLEMVINENMRLMTPIPLVGREAKDDFPLGNGVVLPKGTQVFMDLFHMHRDEANWGPKAKQFDPDNFGDNGPSKENTMIYNPFANGQRVCIGNKYALMETKVIVSKVIRKYKLKTSFKFEDLQFVENVTIKLKEVPLVEFIEREC